MTSSAIGGFNAGRSAIGISTLQFYLDLITSEHNQKPDFMAMLAAIFAPLADGMAVSYFLYNDFDLDAAIGVQLDIVGLWIGRTRDLQVPITGVYFTYDIGPGFDIGIYKGPFDPITGLVKLPDAQYRTLLKATAARNQWDGSVPGAYAAYAILLDGTPFEVLIYDHQDMTMTFALLGGLPDAITAALFTGGYLSLRPDGVGVRDYIIPGTAGPVFGYSGSGNPNIAGFDVGAYAIHIPG